jgi:hypothetical protein
MLYQPLKIIFLNPEQHSDFRFYIRHPSPISYTLNVELIAGMTALPTQR